VIVTLPLLKGQVNLFTPVGDEMFGDSALSTEEHDGDF
jgi:hypothetical protein